MTSAVDHPDRAPVSIAALDDATCYAAVRSRDRRFDGVFYTAVRTTGIYCRPSCPARTPAAANVTFHRSAAAAQEAGFRACKRCLPDATPGSPEWNIAATAVGRAMNLIADGLIDREGVDGLAARVGYSSRHLGRLMLAEVGAGPLALARTQRAQTARVLIETTTLGFADIAFASGFSSVRQFNETLRTIYDASPTDLRARRHSRGARPGTGTGVGAGASGRGADGAVSLPVRLAVRAPFDGRALADFLRLRAIPGVEIVETAPGDIPVYARTLRLPRGPGLVRVELAEVPAEAGAGVIHAQLTLSDVRDTAAALARVRRLLDADADPIAIRDHLESEGALAPLVRARPGLRVPGHVDGAELAVRAVLGQQVSVAGARTLAARLVERCGTSYESGVAGLTHLFPSPDGVAALTPDDLAMPASRARALIGLARALADREVTLDGGSDRVEVREAMLALPGIGPWTTDYIAMRALGHPDVFLGTDVGVRRALQRLHAESPRADLDPARWAPWRSYALMHLWTSLDPAAAAGPARDRMEG